MRIFPLGDSALTIELGSEISVGENRRAISIVDALSANPFNGMIEATAAYASATAFYDPIAVLRAYPEFDSAFAAVSSIMEALLADNDPAAAGKVNTVEIPVNFGTDHAPDLGDAAQARSLTVDEYVEIFLSRTYRVHMLGFLPGFAYMGEVDERIAMPRRATPRLKVPKGSVGIAGSQTGIYPLDSPGGWQIIGRTVIEMFQPQNDPPALLKAGDEVRFILE